MKNTMNVFVSIGVLAHNEAKCIGASLERLLAQDIFDKYRAELIVIPNGCTDRTAEIAIDVIRMSTCSTARSTAIREMREPGKANAWNAFVHHASAREATILFLMDADIDLLQIDTLSSMIEMLKTSPKAAVCVDRPVKDIASLPNPSIFQRLVLAAGDNSTQDHIPLCGQLYCGRSENLRRIRVPHGIVCEDGFLRALLLTNGFTDPDDGQLIVQSSDAWHRFVAVKTPFELIRHEIWIVTGSIVNMLLFKYFSKMCSPSLTAMALMRQFEENNRYWLKDFINQQVKETREGLLPRAWWTRRWKAIRNTPKMSWPIRISIAIFASLVDYYIFCRAIWQVRQGRAFGYWQRGR